MSMSIENLGPRLYFAMVPLFLIVSTAIVVWATLFSDSGDSTRKISLPSFEYQAPEKTSKNDILSQKQQAVSPPRDIFQVKAKPKTGTPSPLDLHEISLGLVIVTEEKRFCLTNGVRYTTGEGNLDFTVLRIETNGVWYLVGKREIYLQPGDKVNVDGQGNVRE